MSPGGRRASAGRGGSAGSPLALIHRTKVSNPHRHSLSGDRAMQQFACDLCLKGCDRRPDCRAVLFGLKGAADAKSTP